MRPILVNIPSKFLLGVAIAVAALGFVGDLWRNRQAPKFQLSSWLLYPVLGAAAIFWLKSPAWGPVPIYAYGVMLGTSLIVGWFVAMRLAKNDGIPEQDAGTIYMWSAVWSIIGARLLWYITDPSPKTILELFKVWQGGLVAYGGMILGFFASWYGCHKRGIPLLKWADVSAPSVVLGTGITRIGCLLFGCDYGRPTDGWWGVRFPGRNPGGITQIFPAGGPEGSPAWQHHVRDLGLSQSAAESLAVHPTQIYESLTGLLLFALLMLIRRHRKFSGEVFLGWVFGYGIMRPLIEIVRDDDDRGLFTLPFIHHELSTSQIIGIVSVIFGLGLLVALVRKYRRDPVGSRLWELPMPALATAGAGAAVGGVGARPSRPSGAKRRKRR